jgi:hypothetical protein
MFVVCTYLLIYFFTFLSVSVTYEPCSWVIQHKIIIITIIIIIIIII